jgi:hypothetical protein
MKATKKYFGKKFSHLTPLYFFNRVNLWIYESMNPRHPWITRDATIFLKYWLRNDDIGLEWGSGRSTLWLAKKVKKLISVEHNNVWYTKVSRELAEKKLLPKVDYRYYKEEAKDIKSPNYINIVKEIKNTSLDFCVVDGIYRDLCAYSILPKLKEQGLLIIDNINWYIPNLGSSRAPNSRNQKDGFESQLWEEFYNKVKNWRCIWTSNGICDTAIWVKNSGIKH